MYCSTHNNCTVGAYSLHSFPLGIEPISGIINAMPDSYKTTLCKVKQL